MDQQIQKIQRLFSPPVFQDAAEKTRIAALLNTMLLTAGFGMLIIMASNLVVGQLPMRANSVLLVFSVIMFGLQIPMRHGFVRQVSILLVALLTVAVTGFIFVNGTIRLPAGPVFFVLASVMAGLLISRRAAMISAFINCLIFFVLMVAELNGSLPSPVLSVTLVQGVAFTICSVATIILLNLATRSIDVSQASTAKANSELQHRIKELYVLNAVAQVGASAKNDDEMLEAVVDTLYRSLYTEIIGVALWDEKAGLLRTHPSAHRGLPESINETTVRPNEGILGVVAASHKPYLLNGLNDPNYMAVAPDIFSELCVPILAGDRLIGVLDVESKQPEAFSAADENLLFTIAGQLASALERLRAEQQLRGLNAVLEQRVIERTQQLEAAVKELEAFSYSVSHDLRAPLRSIAGFSQILNADFSAQLDPVARGFLQKIIAAGGKMSVLIDGLLDFSRLGRKPLKKQPVDLNEIAGNAIDSVATETEGRKIQWIRSALPPGNADPSLIQQVYANLIGNAVKYTSKRDVACIEIGSLAKNNEKIYFVRDNGAGFDMQYSDKLFGVFQRLHRDDEFEGTGIGLATVKRIIDRHGGRIWVEAEPEKGATFYFTLE